MSKDSTRTRYRNLGQRLLAQMRAAKRAGVPAAQLWDEMQSAVRHTKGLTDAQQGMRAAEMFLLLQDVYGEEATRGFSFKR